MPPPPGRKRKGLPWPAGGHPPACETRFNQSWSFGVWKARRAPSLEVGMKRSTNCLSKLDRMRKTLRHQEADRVPVSDFFWGSFLRRWRDELGLPADTDIYRYYDLDWMNVNPNLDPHIRPFEILRENEQEVLVRTGFEAVIRKRLDLPMPAFLEFDTNTVEKMEAFQFDDPWDERRYFRAGDDQINGVGDGFSRNTAPFVGRIEEAYSDFPVFGGVLEANETLTRLIGPENSLQWMALEPDAMGRFIARIFEFSLAILKAQTKAADVSDQKKGHNWPPIINLSEAGGYYFATGSAELTPNFATELRTVVVDKLLEIADSYDVDVIEVIGHTDEQPVNGRASNLDRALSSVTSGTSGAGVLQWADNAGLG